MFGFAVSELENGVSWTSVDLFSFDPNILLLYIYSNWFIIFRFVIPCGKSMRQSAVRLLGGRFFAVAGDTPTSPLVSLGLLRLVALPGSACLCPFAR